jgi:hypothetical protein
MSTITLPSGKEYTINSTKSIELREYPNYERFMVDIEFTDDKDDRVQVLLSSSQTKALTQGLQQARLRWDLNNGKAGRHEAL